ncbi:hypothetical protein Hanom_Chr05g00390571 [Helianthus anomalus]
MLCPEIQWRSLKISTGGSEVTGPKSIYLKIIYKIGGSKTYIPKKIYTKRTYITLLSEKFGGSGVPSGPFIAASLPRYMYVLFRRLHFPIHKEVATQLIHFIRFLYTIIKKRQTFLSL